VLADRREMVAADRREVIRISNSRSTSMRTKLSPSSMTNETASRSQIGSGVVG